MYLGGGIYPRVLGFIIEKFGFEFGLVLSYNPTFKIVRSFDVIIPCYRPPKK